MLERRVLLGATAAVVERRLMFRTVGSSFIKCRELEQDDAAENLQRFEREVESSLGVLLFRRLLACLPHALANLQDCIHF
jgi:hypothetical protein